MHSRILRSDRLLIRRSTVSLGLRMAAALANYVSAIFLARWMDRSDYGSFSMLLSIMALAGTVATLGAPPAIIRFLGQYTSNARPDLAHGAIRYAIRHVLMGGAALSALLISGTLLAGPALSGSPPNIGFALGLALILGYAIMEVQGAIARYFNHIALALGPKDVLWRLLLIPICFLTARLLPQSAQFLTLTIAATGSLFAIAVGQSLLLQRAIPDDIRTAPAKTDASEWRRTALPIWLAAVATTALGYSDTIVTGLLLSPADAALYFAASRTASLASFLLFSITMVVGPEISRFYHSGQFDKLQTTLRFGALVVFVPTLLLLLFWLIAGPTVLRLFGPQYAAAYPVLIVLAVGQTVNATAGCVALLMNMTGHQTQAARIQVSTAALALLAMPIAAYIAGSLGIALVVSAGLALLNIRMISYARRHAGFDSSILGLMFPPK